MPPSVKKKGGYGADQTEKVDAFRAERTVEVVPLELIKLGKRVHSEKVGAFRATQPEKVGAFRANKTKKKKAGGGGGYRGTYPYCFNMGVPPGVCTSNWFHFVAVGCLESWDGFGHGP